MKSGSLKGCSATLSDCSATDKMVVGRFTLAFLLLASAIAGVGAETVEVKYRGLVPLDHFACTPVERSSFIRRVCFDAANDYMVIRLNDTYYHYCGINKETVDLLLTADSMGRFYNASIKGRFDCRTGHVPTY